jgi:hypothetical protein
MVPKGLRNFQNDLGNGLKLKGWKEEKMDSHKKI